MKVTASTVLITGASGGIGYELAELFARDHHNLVLVARNSDKLTQVAGDLQRLGAGYGGYNNNNRNNRNNNGGWGNNRNGRPSWWPF